MVLFILLCKPVLNCKSVNETQVCDPSDESHFAVLSFYVNAVI